MDACAAEHDVPVAVNEFGLIRWEPGAAQFMGDIMDLFEQRGMNHALWEWASSWEPFAWNDAFNFRHGPDPENQADVDSSDLMDVIAEYWGRNTVRPSNTALIMALAINGCDTSGGAGVGGTDEGGDGAAETRSDGATLLYRPDDPQASAQNAAFSPDGRQIVFTRIANGYNDGPAELWIVNVDGTDPHRITPVEDQDNVNVPGGAWNAVNDEIVFASDREEADDIWAIHPDGSGLRRITDHDVPPYWIEPVWSPDGQ